ncbi:MAG: alkaline phosphatase [Alloprevotella sp.]|nr:alkaline phosphatase [Alloprevotella sp.]MBR6376119.1 alkaline phosphatase [Alloprevotella sp.]
MKRIFYFLFILTFLVGNDAYAQKRAKYVFYFIGDGMGVNQVNGAETYLAAREGIIGTSPLLFPSFPYIGLITTQSATNGVTDSAAAGTALASGVKTKNGAIGVLKDLVTAVPSIAHKAKEHGAAVGVTTSVTVDHATPAVFYAHQDSRHKYYDIGKQLGPSDFDFFAGSDFMTPLNPVDTTDKVDLYQRTRQAGYTIVRGYDEFRSKYRKAKKMVLLQPEADSKEYRENIPYVVDQKPGNLKLQDITRAGIEFLTKQKKDGFFLMVEGGMIDKACHANDGAAYVKELIAMDSCVRIAYEFYQKHPDETLIVITADHETGGLSLGRGKYELHLDLLDAQKTSLPRYERHLKRLIKEKGMEVLTWDAICDDIRRNFGIGDQIQPTEHQVERIRRAYDRLASAFLADKNPKLGREISDLTYACAKCVDEHTMIGWQSGGHSNGYVGVYAIGVGAEQFTGRFDNTQIPLRMMKAAGWE